MPTLTGDLAVLIGAVCGSGLVAFAVLVGAGVLARELLGRIGWWKDD